MGAEDHAERLARMEGILSGMQAEMAAMREALLKLIRIEEQMSAHLSREEESRAIVKRLHERLDTMDARLDEAEKRLESLRGPLLWIAGVAASVVAGLVSLILGRVL